jgi:hypothetical protein
MRKKKHNLPKYIHMSHGKYQVNLPRTEGRAVSIGVFEDVSSAVIHRDYMIEQNEKGLVNLDDYSVNKYPKGIAATKSNAFRARVDIRNKQIGIGTYKTIEEAVEARKEYILNLI